VQPAIERRTESEFAHNDLLTYTIADRTLISGGPRDGEQPRPREVLLSETSSAQHGPMHYDGSTESKNEQMASHASPRTTKLYNRTSDEIALDEVEKVVISMQDRHEQC
jgi:hypothetical protein